MKKGCTIAAIVIAVLIIFCGVGAYIFQQKIGNSGLILRIEDAIAEYQKHNPGDQVETSNEAWAAALIADDSGVSSAAFLKILVKSGGGKLLDTYQNPLVFNANEDGSISVVSMGKDGKLGTADDESRLELPNES